MPSYYAPVVMDMFTYFVSYELSFNYTKVINFFFSPGPLVNVNSEIIFKIESKNSHSWDWNIYSATLASYVFCMYVFSFHNK
jgi:hypothetical protein